MGSGIGRAVEVVMEDGTKYAVSYDQRDAAAFERSDYYTENGVFTRVRYMAWKALHRTGQYKRAFQNFETDCVDAWVVNEEPEEVDPTQTDQQPGG